MLFLVQNTKSDRQVKHQPKKDSGFRQTVHTPLSIVLPLDIHSRVREKNLVNNLSQVYIVSDYQRILDLGKHVEKGVLQRIKETGDFWLPDFVNKGVNIWFAVNNIDLLEDTPTGQNTFHGTVVVINQRAEDADPINQSLAISEKLQSSTSLALTSPTCKNQLSYPRHSDLMPLSRTNVRIWYRKTSLKSGRLPTTVLYCTVCVVTTPRTQTRRMKKTLEKCKMTLMSKTSQCRWIFCVQSSDGHGEGSILDQDHTYFLVCVLAVVTIHHTVLDFFDLTTENPESPNDNQEECGEQQHPCETQVILSVKKMSKGSTRLKNEEVMPTWAATKSFLSQSRPCMLFPKPWTVVALTHAPLQQHCVKLRAQCDAYKKALYARSPDMVTLYGDIQSSSSSSSMQIYYKDMSA